MTFPRFALAAAVLAVLSGCAGPALPPAESPAPAAAPPATSSPEATQSTTPEPTNSATPAASGSDWIISTAGWGDLKLGKPVPKDFTLATWDDDFCDHSGAWVFEGYETGAQPTYVLDTKGDDGSGDVVGMIIYDKKVRTPSGLHIGDTLAEAKDAVPKLTLIRELPQSEFWGVTDSLGTIAFEIVDGKIHNVQTGLPSFGTHTAIAGDTAGTCVG